MFCLGRCRRLLPHGPLQPIRRKVRGISATDNAVYERCAKRLRNSATEIAAKQSIEKSRARRSHLALRQRV
jgi:hypothetical protein